MAIVDKILMVLMHCKPLLFFFFLLVFCFTAHANFIFNPRCVQAYQDVFHLKINDASLIIKEEKQLNPQNGINVLLDNYVDYVGLLISEDPGAYEKMKGYKSARIDALEKNDKNSPYYLFAQAEVYLQWGLLKAKFGDYFSSFLDIKKARSLLAENTAKYPDFLPAQKDVALIEIILGVLPSNLKGIAKLVGMSGNTSIGVAQLEKIRTNISGSKFNMYTDEVTFFLCYINIDVLHAVNNYNQLTSYIKDMDDNNALKDYLGGYIAAKSGHNDECIAYLEAIQNTRQQLILPAATYLLGNAKLCRMDSDAAVYLLRYINEYKGTKFIKDTYLKLAYFYFLNNEPGKYNYYLDMARTKGYITDEKDKQALREANDAPPNLDLLKARLFYDGGYYSKALKQLKDKQLNDFKPLREKIEFTYRLGRIYQKTENFNEAIDHYEKAMELGKSTPYYYSANAGLGLGDIFGLKKDYKKAAYYYHLVIDMKNHEYQNSTDYEAKQALDRLPH